MTMVEPSGSATAVSSPLLRTVVDRTWRASSRMPPRQLLEPDHLLASQRCLFGWR
jgi:hypothetical protein